MKKQSALPVTALLRGAILIACSFIWGLLIILFNSCSNDNEAIDPGGNTGKVVPVGQVVGAKVEKEIGPFKLKYE